MELPSEGFALHLLSTLIDEMPSGVMVMDAAGRVLLANGYLETIWRGPAGRDLNTWRGRYSRDHPLHPGDWPIRRVLDSGEAIHNHEIEITRADESWGVIQVNAFPVCDSRGGLTAAVMTVLDITEQRRRTTSRRIIADAGALFASPLDHLSTLRKLARLTVPALADWCSVYLLDPSGEIERVTIENGDRQLAARLRYISRRLPPSLESAVGIRRVIRTGVSELIPEFMPEALEELTRGRKQGKFLRELGLRSVMIVPLVARGSPLGAIAFGITVSDRRFSPEDLEVVEEIATRAAFAVENARLFDQSRAAKEAKSDFLAVMSHELRTPLTTIIGHAELLRLGVPEASTPRQKEQAERIELSGRHLLQLIEEVLTLVTLESGERRVRRTEVELNNLIHQAVAIVEPMARVKNLQMKVTSAPGDPVLRADTDKLLQILLNLLSNAVKFTSRGEIRVRATCDANFAMIEVADTGIGIGPEHLARIFEPFWQAERPLARRAGGTGLGLTICHRLAELLGADLEVRSEQGVGSIFRVRMPV
ncbi:MAG: PAS domain-containing protein [Gemmatimonadota bacterium]|nr:PAS domain-containing protein [Gemmatimonadota bacterium]